MNLASVLYLYQDEFMERLSAQYPESPEIIDDFLKSENAPSDRDFKNEDHEDVDEDENPEEKSEENIQNQLFDSVDIENHSEIRKYLDTKYPDDPNEPKKKLIIISAMFRSGSSFMGSLFGTGLIRN